MSVWHGRLLLFVTLSDNLELSPSLRHLKLVVYVASILLRYIVVASVRLSSTQFSRERKNIMKWKIRVKATIGTIP
eukprot:scaffold1170_cov174-Amphora_coffeaeformis.AAC.9